ncbi:DNA repair and recombination protein RadB [Nanoarchaeota archaeon]
MKRVSTGSILNSILSGGYESDIITTVYGPAASGKTLFCLLCAVEIAKTKKVLYIDTEGGFSVERVKQICKEPDKILGNIFILKPTNFSEQKKDFEKLKEMIDDKIGLIVIDTISMLYRLEMGKTDDVYGINRELGQQISYLSEITRKKNIPVLLTNQVYADFDNKENVKMVGGDILKYGSKCLIELQVGHRGVRKAILIKHRSIPQNEMLYRIVNEGIAEVV